MNYVTIVEAPIDVEITTREEDPAVPEKVELVRLTNKFQFRLPVMVRSRLCSLYGLPNVATQKLGEGK